MVAGARLVRGLPWAPAMVTTLAGAPCSAALYVPRRPQETVLYQCVEEHLPVFLSRAAAAERELPAFVREELEGFLDCGVIERGFARVACGDCGFERLVPFSCKGRGVCPSCIARRMSDTAAHLVDRVLPAVPVRPWVLSVPPPLRYLLAWETQLVSEVVSILMDAVFGHLRAVAKRAGVVDRQKDAHPGAVCMVQRWGGSANLNPHLHAMVVDGAFVDEGSGTVKFRALAEPSRAEIAAVAWEVCQRVVALLRRRGQWVNASPEDDAWANEEPLLAQLYAASMAGTLVMGPKAGQRQVRLFGARAREGDEEEGKLEHAYGFDLDARVRVAASDHQGRERLARYMTRPPLSKERLERLADGRYRIELKRAWRDGTTAIVLEGVELVGRLAALVPPPRAHLTRYFGVFAPRAALRTAVVPKPKSMAPASIAPAAGDGDDEGSGHRQRRLSWAKLLRRVFSVDVLQCPRCSSRLQRVESCTRPERIRAVLARAGPGVPALTPA